jgi:hypothetical protein
MKEMEPSHLWLLFSFQKGSKKGSSPPLAFMQSFSCICKLFRKLMPVRGTFPFNGAVYALQAKICIAKWTPALRKKGERPI